MLDQRLETSPRVVLAYRRARLGARATDAREDVRLTRAAVRGRHQPPARATPLQLDRLGRDPVKIRSRRHAEGLARTAHCTEGVELARTKVRRGQARPAGAVPSDDPGLVNRSGRVVADCHAEGPARAAHRSE